MQSELPTAAGLRGPDPDWERASSKELLQSYAALLQKRAEQIAAPAHAAGNVVDAEVFDFDPPLDFIPTYRC